jgi:O-antigen/teichoic acid export membrane protein
VRPFDAAGTFEPVGGGNARRRAVRGAGVTVVSHALGFAVQTLATVALARLLTPGDFGLIAMVTAFSLLLQNLGLNGITEAVIQREELNAAVATNLFWVSAGLGLCAALGFAAAGPALAVLYGEPRLVGAAVGMAGTIFFTALSVVHLALLKRAMRFADVSRVELCARGAAVAVSIVLAAAGSGYWALVAGSVTLTFTTCVGAWARCRWVPGLPARGVDVRPMLRFATHTYARFSVNYVTRNIDNLLVGWRFGAPALGAYKKAYDLFTLPGNLLSAPLTTVAVSALSRLDGAARQREVFVRALAPLALVGMGAGAALAVVGPDVVVLLLGPQWQESGRLITILALGMGVSLLYDTHGWIHLSVGRADRWLRWGLVELAITGLCFVGGLPWGPAGVAAGWVVSLWVLTVPALWYAGRPVGLDVASVVRSVWTYIVASAAAGAATTVLLPGSSVTGGAASVGAAERVVIGSIVCGGLYLVALVALHRGWAPVTQLVGLVRDATMRERPRHRTPAARRPTAGAGTQP